MAKEKDINTKIVLVKIEELSKEVNNLGRRISTAQKSIDLVYDDRQLLENINGNLVSLKQLVVDHQKHVDTSVKDIKADVGDAKTVVEDKVDEKMNKLITSIKPKKVIFIDNGIFKKIKSYFSNG